MKNILLLTVFLFFSSHIFAKGNCQCPDQLDSAGKRCGRRSAFCRPGGEKPSCGTLTEQERKELRRKACLVLTADNFEFVPGLLELAVATSKH